MKTTSGNKALTIILLIHICFFGLNFITYCIDGSSDLWGLLIALIIFDFIALIFRTKNKKGKEKEKKGKTAGGNKALTYILIHVLVFGFNIIVYCKDGFRDLWGTPVIFLIALIIFDFIALIFMAENESKKDKEKEKKRRKRKKEQLISQKIGNIKIIFKDIEEYIKYENFYDLFFLSKKAKKEINTLPNDATKLSLDKQLKSYRNQAIKSNPEIMILWEKMRFNENILSLKEREVEIIEENGNLDEISEILNRIADTQDERFKHQAISRLLDTMRGGTAVKVKIEK